MTRFRSWLLATGFILNAAAPAFAGPPPTAARDVDAMVARVDELIAKRWAEAKVEPAAPADDAEFLRRVYLDLTGRIPSIAEARAFLADKRPDKRKQLVESLLASPRFKTHLINVYRAMLMPEANSNIIARFMSPSVETWLRQKVTASTRYDLLVRELLMMPLGKDSENALQESFSGGGEPSPLGFFIAKDVKAENLAAATARTFMGIRLECAQCHDHPHANWTRAQFWSQAAFFSGIKRQARDELAYPEGDDLDRKEIGIPGTERIIQATFLDGSTPKFKFKTSPRATLAEWLTAPGNPYFAKAATNRLWGQFFGTGIVDPVDDMLGNDNVKPSHPELLDELAQQFAAHEFDVQYLIRVITASRAYQLSSRRTTAAQDDPALFARAALRGLTPEQLFDSVALATGYVDPAPPGGRLAVFALYTNNPRSEFLTKFANQHEKATEVETSILQALALMNGKFIAEATAVEKSTLLAGVIDAPFLETAGRIETLYLATLSRQPKPRELERLVKYVEGEDAPAAKITDVERQKRHDRALTDVYWSLLNSGEFFLNH